MQTIRDAYISVEIADQGLECLREGLRALIPMCEDASTASHVSIAYGEGEVEMAALDRVTSEIASLPFAVHVAGFEILKGETTPFDYLVVVLEGSSFGAAVSAAQGSMKVRSFEGGFRSHVSLLKFPKGAFSSLRAEEILLEMNACQQVARSLGRPSVSLRGAAVSVFGQDRCCCLSKSFAA